MTATAVALVLALSAPAFADAISNNFSTIEQIGNGGTATVTQDASQGSYNTSTIEQTGEGKALVTQWGEANTSISAVKQDFDAKAEVNQSGAGNYNQSEVYQSVGWGNSATVNQSGNAISNISLVDQQGHNNTATVNQY
jgi:hypothetical protein